MAAAAPPDSNAAAARQGKVFWSKKRKLYARHAVTISFACAVVICVFTTLDVFRREHHVLGQYYPSLGGFSYTMDISLRVQAFDAANARMVLEGEISNANGFTDAYDIVTLPFEIHFFGGDTQIFSYQKGQLLTSFTANVRLLNGSINDYPFDRYDMALDITLNIDDDSPLVDYINFNLRMESRVVAGFKIDFPAPTDKRRYMATPGTKLVQLTAERASVFKFYPMFVMVAMWVVTLVALSMAMHIVIWRKRRAELPMLIVYSGMMFALPSFRGSAPLVPPVGCLMDFSSFFWTMIIAIFSFVGIFVIIIIQD